MARFFATCARGLEPILADELRELGADDIAPGRGGTAFAGDKALLYRANLWLRTAIRILQPILEADVTSPDELYEAVKGLDWAQYLTPDHTLAVDANVRDSHLTHSKYAALRVKDAICDQFIERVSRRPSVDVDEPMVGLNLHVYRDRAVLSLESSGESLHKRGYRPVLTKAPLNEALAAAIILLTGWRGDGAIGRSDVRLRRAADRGGVVGSASAAGTDAPPVRVSGMDGLRCSSVDGPARRGASRSAEATAGADPWLRHSARCRVVCDRQRAGRRDRSSAEFRGQGRGRLSTAGRAAGCDRVQSALRRTHRRRKGPEAAISHPRRGAVSALRRLARLRLYGESTISCEIGIKPGARCR